MSEQKNQSIYAEFSSYIDNYWYKSILVKLLPILEKHGIAIYDEPSIIRAYKEKISRDALPLLHIELYLKSGWEVDVTINSENKIYTSISGACQND